MDSRKRKRDLPPPVQQSQPHDQRHRPTTRIFRSDLMLLGWPWQRWLGLILVFVGLVSGLVMLEIAYLDSVFPMPATPPAVVRYEYRLVSPAEAMPMVNEQGWRVSERVPMTDQAVYLYRP